jgi:hypothetical protein
MSMPLHMALPDDFSSQGVSKNIKAGAAMALP